MRMKHSEPHFSGPAACRVVFSAAVRRTGGGTAWAQVLIVAENTGDKDLSMVSCSLTLTDGSGQTVSTKLLSSFHPAVIPPGGRSYLYEAVALNRPAEGPLTAVPHLRAEPAPSSGGRFEVSDVHFIRDRYGAVCAEGRVTNTGKTDAERVRAVLVLKDKSGAPAALLFATIPQPLSPGAQAGFRMSTLSLPETLDLDDIQGCEAFAYSPPAPPRVL